MLMTTESWENCVAGYMQTGLNLASLNLISVVLEDGGSLECVLGTPVIEIDLRTSSVSLLEPSSPDACTITAKDTSVTILINRWDGAFFRN